MARKSGSRNVLLPEGVNRYVERTCVDCGDVKIAHYTQVSVRCRACNLRKVSAERRAALAALPKAPPKTLAAACPACGKVRHMQPGWARQQPLCRGCSRRGQTTHGFWGHPLYGVWATMLGRCGHHAGSAPEVTKRYAGRGIEVCEEWRNDAGAFCRWALANGWAPGLEIDRKNGDLGYSPDNCRIVTRVVNARNNHRSPPESVIIELKTLLCAGHSGKDVAARLGLSENYVSAIKCGRSWRGVGPDTSHLIRQVSKPRRR
jgi:hypothetical protein